MRSESGIGRRTFLKAAALFAGARAVSATALGRGADPPSERVAVGAIGVGGRGQYDLRRLMSYGAEVIAVCDVRYEAREQARAIPKNPVPAYNDFRDLLDRKDIDGVLVATPDHWHVLLGIAAIKAGKDVYVEKPLGITVAEGQAMLKAVKASDRVFMHGTEQRGDPAVRRICEIVRSGRIGKLRRIVVACPGGQEIPAQPEMEIPKGFDYDMWLGPAPKKPYTQKRCEGPYFFFISDYSPSGFVCAWGVHHIDIAQWGNGTDDTYPIEIEGSGVYPKDGLADTALTWKITYRYANGVEMIFTDSSQNPEGFRFEGTDGWIFKAYGQEAQASDPAILTSEAKPGDVRLYETDADDHCFLECVKSRKPTCSPIDVAHRSSTIGYIGDIAMRAGRRLRWDPAKEVFIGDEEANKLLSRPIRAPWKL